LLPGEKACVDAADEHTGDIMNILFTGYIVAPDILSSHSHAVLFRIWGVAEHVSCEVKATGDPE
jgi:hypothetical protein